MAPARLESRAKLNLALHVVGRRADGYHLLDSIVAFADVPDGDHLIVEFDAPAPSITVSGPFAALVPADANNIIMKAAAALGEPISVHLHKGLPVGAGIGGGSSNAATLIAAVADRRGEPHERYTEIALGLGADVPVCLEGRPCRMEGIGEQITPIDFPEIPAVLVNCGTAVSTAAVYKGLIRRDHPPLAWDKMGAGANVVEALCAARNDLFAPAVALAPEIETVVSTVQSQADCRLARMSGSGATVFGIFADNASRDAAAAALSRETSWWVRACTIEGAHTDPKTATTTAAA